MHINSLQLSAAFGAIQISVYPVTAVHKAALCLQALLYEMEIKSTKRTNHRRLASRNGGVDSRAVQKKMAFRIFVEFHLKYHIRMQNAAFKL